MSKRKYIRPICSKIFPMKNWNFAPKNEVNPGNRFRDIKSIHMYRENWPPIAALLDFFQNFDKNILLPYEGLTFRAKK